MQTQNRRQFIAAATLASATLGIAPVAWAATPTRKGSSMKPRHLGKLRSLNLAQAA